MQGIIVVFHNSFKIILVPQNSDKFKKYPNFVNFILKMIKVDVFSLKNNGFVFIFLSLKNFYDFSK